MPIDNHPKKGNLLSDRPTEIVSALAIASAIYGYCAENGVPNGIALVIALVCGLGPFVISNTVDRIRARQ